MHIVSLGRLNRAHYRAIAWSWKGVGRYIGLLALALVVAGCESRAAPGSTTQKTHQSVSVRQVQVQSSYFVGREFLGVVQAPQRVDLGFDSSGAMLEVLVKEGDWVEDGQVLAKLDSSVLEANLASAVASRQDLNARLKLAQKELKRLETLREKNYAAESQIDTLVSQRQSLRAQLNGAQANITSLERQLEKKVLHAPFSARVAARFVDRGAVVQPGMPVVQLLEAGKLEARVGIPVRMARKIKLGATYTAIVEGKEYRAIVKSLGSSVNQISKTVATELEIVDIDANKKLLDGQIVRLVLDEERDSEGAWISVDSLVAGTRGTWDVYVLVEPGAEIKEADGVDLRVIERRKVSVEYIGGGGAYISYGLNSGDWVADAGVQKLAVGQLVKIGRKVNVADSRKRFGSHQ